MPASPTTVLTFYVRRQHKALLLANLQAGRQGGRAGGVASLRHQGCSPPQGTPPRQPYPLSMTLLPCCPAAQGHCTPHLAWCGHPPLLQPVLRNDLRPLLQTHTGGGGHMPNLREPVIVGSRRSPGAAEAAHLPTPQPSAPHLVQRAQVDGAQLVVDGCQVTHSQQRQHDQRQRTPCSLCRCRGEQRLSWGNVLRVSVPGVRGAVGQQRFTCKPALDACCSVHAHPPTHRHTHPCAGTSS